MSKYGEYGDTEYEVVPGVLRGYRAWRFDSQGRGLLLACNFNTQWERGQNAAACKACACGLCQNFGSNHPEQAAPVTTCVCGIYAKHHPGDYDPRGNVVGVIKAYGKVVLGTKGFRAQYAEIEALSCGRSIASYYRIPSVNAMAKLKRDYGVPYFRTHDEMVRNFPPVSVRELLPEKGLPLVATLPESKAFQEWVELAMKSGLAGWPRTDG